MLRASGLSLPGRLHTASLELRAGEFVCLIGPNGSGKTSLLHALAGIGAPTGTVALDGVDPRTLPPSVRPAFLTYLPASRDVPWPLLARDVIALGGGAAAFPTLELQPFLDRPINRLSTGERSRVLIARALAPRPKLLLLDEPTANLDPLWQIRLMALVREELKTGERAALVAIHDLDSAELYADRVIVMNEGRIVAEGMDQIPAVFGVERRAGRWEAIRPPADPRSSP
ncbi:MAG TPA: ABC transporter ATP-binding protein [Allosphingosinicella sp.]|nr:ABC transporter ATP-binding protein [Allosphingosinicella sp.]